MRMSFGNGGWVRVDLDTLPGPLYVRFQHIGERWRPTELYLDGRDQLLIGEMLRRLPLPAIEDAANEYEDVLASRVHAPGVDLSVLASHYGTTFSRKMVERNWVAASFYAQFPGSKKVERASHREDAADVDLAMVVPPLRYAADGRSLTDDFLKSVAEAMAAAGRVKDAPAKFLAEREDVSDRTVHKWMYTARKRGVVKPGRPGRSQRVKEGDDGR